MVELREVRFSDKDQVQDIFSPEYSPINPRLLSAFRDYMKLLGFPTQEGRDAKATRLIEPFARGFLEQLRVRPELLESWGVREDNIRATASALAQEFRFPEGTYLREEIDSGQHVSEEREEPRQEKPDYQEMIDSGQKVSREQTKHQKVTFPTVDWNYTTAFICFMAGLILGRIVQ